MEDEPTPDVCKDCHAKSVKIDDLEKKLSDSEGIVEQLLLQVKNLEIELETARGRCNILRIEKDALTEALVHSSLKKEEKGR